MGLRVVEEVGRTDVGRTREGNEDALLEQPPLFLVADGMGGRAAGEVASRTAAQTFQEGLGDDPEATPASRLIALAKTANKRIYQLAQEDGARAGMGTTLTAVLVGEEGLALAHVGDSRLYRLREGDLEQLTRDHSFVGELVREGKLTPEEAEQHPQRSMIMRALGVAPEVEVDAQTVEGMAGDVYLLCSDGLTGMVHEDQIHKILLDRESLATAAQQLIDAANDGGGRDNISVILFRLGSDEDTTISGTAQLDD